MFAVGRRHRYISQNRGCAVGLTTGDAQVFAKGSGRGNDAAEGKWRARSSGAHGWASFTGTPPGLNSRSYRTIQPLDSAVPPYAPNKRQSPPNRQIKDLCPKVAKNYRHRISNFRVMGSKPVSKEHTADRFWTLWRRTE